MTVQKDMRSTAECAMAEPYTGRNLQFPIPTVLSSLLVSSASPLSILIAATSKQEANETTNTMPTHVQSISLTKTQRTRLKSTSRNNTQTNTNKTTTPTQKPTHTPTNPTPVVYITI